LADVGSRQTALAASLLYQIGPLCPTFNFPASHHAIFGLLPALPATMIRPNGYRSIEEVRPTENLCPGESYATRIRFGAVNETQVFVTLSARGRPQPARDVAFKIYSLCCS
jgi:hypothetical protein